MTDEEAAALDEKWTKNPLFITILVGIVVLAFASCSLDGASTGGNGGGDGGNGSIAAPSKVSATGTTQTSITVTWTAVSGAAKYKVYTSVTSTGVYRYVDETEERTYVVSDLVADSTYYFKVTSVSTDGTEGPRSSYAAASTLK
jgi:hypothetical protein